MHLRPAEAHDLELLIEGNRAIAAETESLVLDQTVLQSGVKAVLNDASKGRYVVACDDAGQVVGMLMLTFEWSDWRNQMMWWIQSVYVWPDHRQKGVFKALLKSVETEARADGVTLLRLYAEVDNTVAHRTYRARGFQTGHYQVFEKDLG